MSVRRPSSGGVADKTHCGLLVNFGGHSAGQVGSGFRDYRDGDTLGVKRLAGAGLAVQLRRRSSQRLTSEGGRYRDITVTTRDAHSARSDCKFAA